jgi:hypothetical protein
MARIDPVGPALQSEMLDPGVSRRSFGHNKKNGQTRVTGFAHNHWIVT